MAKIVIDIPNKILNSMGETTIAESIKDFLLRKYQAPNLEVMVSKIKKAPSLRFKNRKRLGDWKVIDRV